MSENIYHYNKIRDDQVKYEKAKDKILDICMKRIFDDIKQYKRMTTFRIPIENSKCPLWDCKLVSYFIMCQLRNDDFIVKYSSPNILYILHPMIYYKKMNDEKMKIYNILSQENIKTMQYFNK
jgi:hypothetical protein